MTLGSATRRHEMPQKHQMHAQSALPYQDPEMNPPGQRPGPAPRPALLDATDLRILAELQRDGALSNVALARRVHLSPSPCLARVKALEAAGIIDRYVAIANPSALGLGLNVFISISLKTQSKEALAEFERRIAEHDEVMECYLMTGDSDYLIRVALADIGALERFVLESLTPIPGIEKIRSSFALKRVRYKTALPLSGGLGRGTAVAAPGASTPADLAPAAVRQPRPARASRARRDKA
jgi:Lrp/AsnC family transcriptional regulator, leucine-responsive regulatory protein